jgi:hypothetical protein
MREVSLVGGKGEEVGANFIEYNNLLEKHIPILKFVLPWGKLTDIPSPQESDDGPIWWVRPGEQSIPTGQTGPSTPTKTTLGRVGSKRARNTREKEIWDRTLPHLDHVDNPRQTTHAVGILKAVSLGKYYPG